MLPYFLGVPSAVQRHSDSNVLSAPSSDVHGVRDCLLQFSNADHVLHLPEGYQYETYNPTALHAIDGNSFIGMVRVFITMTAEPDKVWHQYDVLVEYEAPLDTPCQARMVRLVGEGEDPRMLRAVDGRTFAHFQRYERWDVGGMNHSRPLIHRQLSLLEWGATFPTVDANTSGWSQLGLMSSRLIFRKDPMDISALLAQAATGDKQPEGKVLSDAVQHLLGSCDVLRQHNHVRCEQKPKWTFHPSSSYVDDFRVPAKCIIDLRGAIHELVLNSSAFPGAPETTALVDAVVDAIVGNLNDLEETTSPIIGRNWLLQSVGFLSEKNWSPFMLPGGKLGILYQFQDFIAGSLSDWEHAGILGEDGMPQPTCSHCYGTSDASDRSRSKTTHAANTRMVRQLRKQGLTSSRDAILNEYQLPSPSTLAVQEKGDSAIHLNGVPLLRVSGFRGHDDALLGVVHLVSEATWLGGYGMIHNATIGRAILYTHFFFMAAHTDDGTLEPIAISSGEIPLSSAVSKQRWFGRCDVLNSSVAHQLPWDRTGGEDTEGAACALKVAFVSGLEKIGDTLHLFYGAGDSDARLLRMSVGAAEALFD
jgi:hypothetical protein